MVDDAILSAGSGSRRGSPEQHAGATVEGKFRATTRTQIANHKSPKQVSPGDTSADFNAAFAREIDAVSKHGMRNSRLAYQQHQEAQLQRGEQLMKDVITSQGIKIEKIERRGQNGDVQAVTPKRRNGSPPKKRERKHLSVLPQNVFKLDVEGKDVSPKRKHRNMPVIKKRQAGSPIMSK